MRYSTLAAIYLLRKHPFMLAELFLVYLTVPELWQVVDRELNPHKIAVRRRYG